MPLDLSAMAAELRTRATALEAYPAAAEAYERALAVYVKAYNGSLPHAHYPIHAEMIDEAWGTLEAAHRVALAAHQATGIGSRGPKSMPLPALPPRPAFPKRR